jgi:hypothetical protein
VVLGEVEQVANSVGEVSDGLGGVGVGGGPPGFLDPADLGVEVIGVGIGPEPVGPRLPPLSVEVTQGT